MMGPIWPDPLPLGRKSAYLFDAWPGNYGFVRKLVSALHLSGLYVSSSQAAATLDTSLPACRVSWVPEGIDASVYTHLPYEAKDIDVIQIGRKYDVYHERVREPLEAAERSYLYERVKGQVIFPTRAGFIDGISRARVSVCFPSNLTHPERSGSTETMTQRYLQSMASKCLVVGHAPAEMVALFGYNPVLEADMDDPFAQLTSVLAAFHEYVPLIERNYRTVLAAHTWDVRWRMIAQSMRLP